MISISKPQLGREELSLIKNVVRSGRLAQGNVVRKLEKHFGRLCKTKYAIATNSGTSALHTALYAIGVTDDDEIITTAFSFIATANAILMAGAKPVFVDIEEQTYNLDPTKIEKAITNKTKAIIAVDLYGQPADYEAINHIARRHDLLVIDDAAQSINATYKGRKTGNLADISCFSFYATKNITSGEGGMITTNNMKYFERAQQFRNHSQREDVRYDYLDIGYNYRLTELQAAILLAQLEKLSVITKKRQTIAKKYNGALDSIRGLVTPQVLPDATHVYHQYTLRVTSEYPISRDEFQAYLEKRGIQSVVYYPTPLYRYRHLRSAKIRPNNFPATNQAAREALSIPVHPKLTHTQVDYIIKTILSV